MTSAERAVVADILTNSSQKKDELHVCQVCGKCFVESHYMWSHFKSHVREKPDAFEDLRQTKLSKGHVQCRSQCSRVRFRCEKSERRHTFSDDLKVCKEEHCRIDKYPFKCENCGKSFMHRRSLVRHAVVHTGREPFACELCGKTFISLGGLHHHISTHCGKRPHVCKKCGKAYVYRHELVVHGRTHSGEEPYVCKKCGKSFPTMKRCQRHIAGHYVK